MEFRDLRADEIDCRVSTVSEKGCSLLLYKDARCDMNILDETVGAECWQRSHELINGNLFCNVSIKCGDEWVSKQDVGTESYTEKEKGQASDSFKRACFNWGLGRELYTAPFIWIPAEKCNIVRKNDKCTTCDRFEVAEIRIEKKKITGLSIRNVKTNSVCYTFGGMKTKPKATVQEKEIRCPDCGNIVKPIIRPDDTVATPEEVFKGCGGICYACYQKKKGEKS